MKRLLLLVLLPLGLFAQYVPGSRSFTALTGGATSTATGGATTINGLYVVTDTGTANTYTSAVDASAPALADGILIDFVAVHASTGASTFAYQGGSARAIVDQTETALTSGMIPVGHVLLKYKATGTKWILLDALNQSTTANAGTATTAANLSGTPALPNGTTATTQSQADGTTKLATTAYVDTGLGGKAASGASTSVNSQTCALGGSCTVTVTPTGAGLSNVTNDTQTKAAVVPNTAPSAGQILVGNAGGSAYAPVSVSGCTLTSTGELSCSGLQCLDTGAVNAITCTQAGVTAYAAGLQLTVTPLHTNTGAATLTVNSLASLPVQRNGAALTGGDYLIGQPVTVICGLTACQIGGSGPWSDDGSTISAASGRSVAIPTALPGALPTTTGGSGVLVPVLISTSGPVSPVATGFYINNASRALTYTLPAITSANVGLQVCVRNAVTKTGAITLTAPASTYIDVSGAVGSAAGTLVSGGALGDAACVVAVDTTHYYAFIGVGTWNNN